MSKRAIVLLAIVVAALSAYIALFERGSVTSKELAERSGRVLVSFVREKVERIEIQRKGKRVVLSREGKTATADNLLTSWDVLEPMKAKADSDAIDPLLGELEWLSARRTLEAPSAEDAVRFGLTAPRYRVRYVVGGRSHTLVLGKDDVHGEGVYVRVDDEPRALVVPKSVLEPLNHEPSYFREKKLFTDVVLAWTQKLTIGRGDATVALVREEGRWWIAGDPKAYGDEKRVSEMVEVAAELRAARYLEPEELAAAEAALKSPTLRITLDVVPDAAREDRTSKRYTVEIAGRCGAHENERYLRVVDGPIGCITEGDLKLFEATSDELRDRSLLSVDSSAVEGFELSVGSSKITLSREGEGWKGKGADPIDRRAVEAWLKTLTLARATGFAQPKGFRERAVLTLRLAGDKSSRIAIGEVDAQGALWVRRNREELMVSFAGALSDVLTPIPTRFASLEVWRDHQPSQIVEAEARADGHHRSWALESGSWKLKAGEIGGDVTRLRELLRALIDLHARVYVTDKPRPLHGVAPGRGMLRLKLNDGTKLALTLGAATPGGAFALLDGGPVIELDRDTVGWLTELAGGPRAPIEPTVDDEEPPDHDEDGHDHGH